MCVCEWAKDYVVKDILKMPFWRKTKSSWAKATDQKKISAKSLMGSVIHNRYTSSFTIKMVVQIRVNDATADTFSVKCFNPLKLYTWSVNILRKRFASYFLYIHDHLIKIDPQR